MAEIGREMSAILDLDELLTRLAHLVKRLIDYRTFGIALWNDEHELLEMKIAISYGDAHALAPVKLGEGLMGYAALHKEAVLGPGRVEGLALHQRGERRPLRAGDSAPAARTGAIGVFDLESPSSTRSRRSTSSC